MRRIVTVATLALFVAALIPAVIFAILTPLVQPGDSVARLGMIVVFFFYAAIPTVGLALPAFLIFLRFNMVRWWTTLIAGFVIGIVVVVAGPPSGPLSVDRILVMGFIGVAAALGFWLVWKYGNQSPAAKQ